MIGPVSPENSVRQLASILVLLGTLAAGIVAKSPADGYTLIVTPSAHAYAASMYDKLPFDPVKDFRPVGQIGMMPLVAIANKAFPAGSLRDLVEREFVQDRTREDLSSSVGGQRRTVLRRGGRCCSWRTLEDLGGAL